ncbi:unnamed protein product [Adineta ricciae]|uniref:Diacylglycerol kinase n=1 Tax=Adineta ricciae TaxID=249248 RepID=A0A814RQB0_ADIRI|nr:unnamed protein product [Adineta ricciae]
MSNATSNLDSGIEEIQHLEETCKLTDSSDYEQKNSLTRQEPSGFPMYGVDWSKHAKSTSHCWLPYLSKKMSSSRLCACLLCQKSQLRSDSSFVECPTCSLIVHSAHLSELTEADTYSDQCSLPPCRSSFMDDSITDDNTTYDQHCWSPISNLSKPCTYCKNKKLKTNSNGRHDQEMLEAGFVCMWCSRHCHRLCWENIKNDANNNQCDYGEFGNIIVRPQWLHRATNNPCRFQACMSKSPDANDNSLAPVIFFVNKLSGGQKGQEFYRTLVRLLNPRQVFLLEDDSTVTQALEIYSSLHNARVCICGGDGTVGWILSHLVDRFPSLTNLPAGICPLGTGNDLSRVLGWGNEYTSARLFKTLTEIARAHPVALDRWKIHLETLDPDASDVEFGTIHRSRFSFREHPKFIRNAELPVYDNHRAPINSFFFNYISFGLDAAVVMDFHARRTRDPSEFTSPFKNKLMFINESRKYFNEFAFGIAWNIGSYIRLICDGQDLTNTIRNYHSVVLLNTPGFGSGTQPWGRTSTTTAVNDFEAQDFSDRMIEVLALNTTQMALIHVGFRGTRIAQCRQVRVELSHPMPVHMDGEPFYLAGSTAVDITHAGQEQSHFKLVVIYFWQ